VRACPVRLKLVPPDAVAALAAPWPPASIEASGVIRATVEHQLAGGEALRAYAARSTSCPLCLYAPLS